MAGCSSHQDAKTVGSGEIVRTVELAPIPCAYMTRTVTESGSKNQPTDDRNDYTNGNKPSRV